MVFWRFCFVFGGVLQNEPLAAMEAQLMQLRTEKRFLLNSVVNSQKKDEIIQILVNQLKYNAPRQYLKETAAFLRQMTTSESNPKPVTDKDIERVCYLLEQPIDLVNKLLKSCWTCAIFPLPLPQQQQHQQQQQQQHFLSYLLMFHFCFVFFFVFSFSPSLTFLHRNQSSNLYFGGGFVPFNGTASVLSRLCLSLFTQLLLCLL